MRVLPLLLLTSLTTHGDDRISKSRGTSGGVVVLWPRVVPATEDANVDAVAARVQGKLAELTRSLRTDVVLDVRPDPERTCPQSGCLGKAIGAVVAHKDGGCVVVVTLSEPGLSAATLVPWAGTTRLKATEVPFREPPENAITVDDYVPCGELTSLVASDSLTARLRAFVGTVN